MCGLVGSTRSIYGRNGNMCDGRQPWLRASLRQPPVDLWTTHRVANNPHAQPPQKRSIDALRKAVTLTRQRQSGLAGHLNSQAFAPLLRTHYHPPVGLRQSAKGRSKFAIVGTPLKLTRTGKVFFIMLLCS